MSDSLLDRALQMLTDGPFLMLGAPVADQQPVHWQAAPAAHEPQPQPHEFATWLPRDALAFSVMCIPHPLSEGETAFVLYDQERRALYYLRRDAWLPKGVCPPHTTLLAHFVEDAVAEHVTRGNLLVFDILRYRGDSTAGMDAAARYALLRRVGEGFNTAVMSMQWAGELGALRAFLATGGITHPVRAPLVLGCEPLRPVALVDSAE
jgi:hypothetical protein